MQTYINHRFSAEGLVILTDKSTEVLVGFDAARQIIKDLRQHLGDYSDQCDDHHPHPLPGMKYGSIERQ